MPLQTPALSVPAQYALDAGVFEDRLILRRKSIKASIVFVFNPGVQVELAEKPEKAMVNRMKAFFK